MKEKDKPNSKVIISPISFNDSSEDEVSCGVSATDCSVEHSINVNTNESAEIKGKEVDKVDNLLTVNHEEERRSTNISHASYTKTTSQTRHASISFNQITEDEISENEISSDLEIPQSSIDLSEIVINTKNNSHTIDDPDEILNCIIPPREVNIIYDKIIPTLPSIIQQAAPAQRINREQRKLIITATCIIASGMLPNVRGLYGGTMIGTNLNLMVLGNSGQGKGMLSFVRRLPYKVHKAKIENHKIAMAEYETEMELWEQAKKNNQSFPKPKKPILKNLILSANSSKSSLIAQLCSNLGEGIIFETEMITLVDSLGQEYAGFIDIILKAFQHEPASMTRRKDSEHIEIDKLYLSIILSGTFSKFNKLVSSTEDGTFSRFIFYLLEQDQTFHKVFDKILGDMDDYYEKYAEFFSALYFELESRSDNVVIVKLQQHQEDHFHTYMQEGKTKLLILDETLGGICNRLGIMCFRIAMILSVIRKSEEGPLPDQIICTDADYDSAIAFTEIFKLNMLAVFDKMPKPQISISSGNNTADRNEVLKQIYTEYKKGASARAIAKKIFDNVNAKDRVLRLLKEAKKQLGNTNDQTT